MLTRTLSLATVPPCLPIALQLFNEECVRKMTALANVKQPHNVRGRECGAVLRVAPEEMPG